jgi:flagellar basal-body rod modification protein FlgD
MSRVDSAASSSGTTTGTGTKKINDLKDLDINHFLQLMISELTNQDPLNPMDNTQLVQQLGSIREIAATDKLSTALSSLQAEQSLTTASGLIGKEVTALTTDNKNISGVVDRVTVDVDSDNQDKRRYLVHIGDQEVELKNVRSIEGN